jgi:glycosyltransferase 2 family protein
MTRLTLRGLLAWGGLLVSLVFIYLAFRGIDFGALRAALARSNYWVLVPALLVLAVAIVLRALRWRMLFSAEHRPPFGVVTSAVLIGYLFNSILPARAGEAVRVIVLNQRAGTPRFVALGTVVAERALDVLCLLLLLFATAPALPSADWLPRVLVLGGVLFAGVAAALVAVAFHGERPARLVLAPLAILPRMSRNRLDLAATNLVRGLAAFRRASIALPALALTAASWLLIALSSWICMEGFHLRLGFPAGVLVVVAINLAMILPSGPAGLGVFEAATVAALVVYDVDKSTALSYALVLHGVNLIPFLLAGYIALQHHALALSRGNVPPADAAAQPLGEEASASGGVGR